MSNLTEAMELEEAVTENWTLKGVKICGTKSLNKTQDKKYYRTYSEAALQRAIPMYENSAVFVEHDTSKKRRYDEMVGAVKNVRWEKNALYGDIELNPSKPLASSIMWDFNNKTKRVGLSHTAKGDVDAQGIVNNITVVESVDVVYNPSTSQTLTEETELCDDPLTLEQQNMESELAKYKADFATLGDKLVLLSEAVVALEEKNNNLLQEVTELKKKPVVSKNVLPTIDNSVPKINQQEFVNYLKGKK